ncbi:MAG: hypothetical protein QOI74_3303, partial [Micromonosporaceae bacterium]|nr:hypothetical protein [Micromonosporaceae bacterium]
WQQRVRQAYDDLAQPVKLAAILPLLPGLVVAARRRRPRPVLAGALLAVAVAEVGRRRAAGRHVFPATASALAPVWLLERAACGWLAVGLRVFSGGTRYAGGRLRVAAHSPRELAARLADH